MTLLPNIQSLTEFKRNASSYVEALQGSHEPLVLTVNGRAAVVVQTVEAFQSQANELKAMEAELEVLKLAALRRDIQLSLDQLERGEYTDYTEDTIDQLFEDIRARGLARRAARSPCPKVNDPL